MNNVQGQAQLPVKPIMSNIHALQKKSTVYMYMCTVQEYK